jgi:hypothetical protein
MAGGASQRTTSPTRTIIKRGLVRFDILAYLSAAFMQLPLMPDTVKNNSAKTVQFLENVGERDMGKGNEQHSRENHLLSVLPEAERARVAPHLVPVEMPLGLVVYESGDRLDHVYFPTTSIVSLLYVMEDGASAEIAIVGNEGIVGIALFMGGETTPNRAVVQSAGQAYRLDARILKEEFHRAGPAVIAALYPGIDHPDGPDRRLQPASFDRPAIVPLAAAQHGPPAVKRAEDDTGADRQHAWRAQIRRDGSGAETPGRGADPLRSWPHRGTGSTWTRKACVRVLWRGETGVRPVVA